MLTIHEEIQPNQAFVRKGCDHTHTPCHMPTAFEECKITYAFFYSESIFYQCLALLVNETDFNVNPSLVLLLQATSKRLHTLSQDCGLKIRF